MNITLDYNSIGEDSDKGDSRRNQWLRNKFLELRAEMPAHVNHWFDNAHKSAKGERRTRTEIIDNCFDKVNGRWVMNCDKPFFLEAKTK